MTTEKMLEYFQSLDLNSISEERRTLLDQLIHYISSSKNASLTFICIENSRRSHFAQVWASVASSWFNISIPCYSGGTKATAVNPRTIAALIRAGLDIKLGQGENPRHTLKIPKSESELILFSKVYNDPFNPSSNFAAVMVCSAAETACPYIPEADKRLAITYEDPKSMDDTPSEEAAYDQTCKLIATEMFYVFKTLSNAK